MFIHLGFDWLGRKLENWCRRKKEDKKFIGVIPESENQLDQLKFKSNLTKVNNWNSNWPEFEVTRTWNIQTCNDWTTRKPKPISWNDPNLKWPKLKIGMARNEPKVLKPELTWFRMIWHILPIGKSNWCAWLERCNNGKENFFSIHCMKEKKMKISKKMQCC